MEVRKEVGMTSRPWDDIELSDEPGRKLTLRETIELCEGDVDRAIYYYDFKNIGSDIFEHDDPRLLYTGPHIVGHEDSPTIVDECMKRDDGTHCVHWWEGDEPCCSCGMP